VTTPEIHVRPAGSGDRRAVQRLICVAYAEFAPVVGPDHWPTMMANLARVVDEAGADELIVATVDEHPIGTVTYYPPGPRRYDRVPTDWAVIRALAVDPAWRGCGVGAALTAECLRRARSGGVERVGLHTSEMMAGAVRVYRRAGFEPIRKFNHLGMSFQVMVTAPGTVPAPGQPGTARATPSLT
jgi:GNAT superfamily N-acetyltransferase